MKTCAQEVTKVESKAGEIRSAEEQKKVEELQDCRLGINNEDTKNDSPLKASVADILNVLLNSGCCG